MKTNLSKAKPVLFYIVVILTVFSPSAWAELPKAVMSDYVWTVIKPTIDDDSGCSYNGDAKFDAEYQQSLYNEREQMDNTLSQQWGISDKVAREKDTIYIDVPNRKYPLTFKDNAISSNYDYSSYYSLERYDQSRQLLFLHESLYESENIVMINLATGFWQDFYQRKLYVSPNMEYMASFEAEMGATEDINIWQLQDNGYYKGYYKEVYNSYKDAKIFESHRTFYQADEANSVYDAETITWVNDSEFNADYFYKLNVEDSAAFRVRYNFIRDDKTGNWAMSAVKPK